MGESLKMTKLLVIGDVIDDIIVVPQGEIRTNTDTRASIEQTLGGSASNVASWAASNKAAVTFVGCVSTKDIERVTKDFEHFGVHCDLQRSQNRTGSLVVLVQGSNRSMLTDRGANQDLDLDELTEHKLAAYKYVYLSGYSILNKSPEEIQSFIRRVHDADSILVIDPGSTGFIEDYGIAKFKEAIGGVDILLPNQEEFALLGTIAKTTIVTKGAFGVDLYIDGAISESFDSVEVESIDPTGAGDSFAGGLLAGLVTGLEMRNAITAGINCAAMAVTTIGARPKL